ncbi:hypothetical protein EBB07_32770 [Paenibacillaceae bacterium]|nr:hypothetical protein EBB07_32770 [Paenibacillaceae bacterium]
MANNEQPSHIVAIDIGTTSAKALVFALDGGETIGKVSAAETAVRTIARAEREYPLHVPKPGWAEQDPRLITLMAEEAVSEAISAAKLSADDLLAISFSTAMHSLIMVDKSGEPLTKSITWADTRAEGFAQRLREREDTAELHLRTGVPIHAMTPLCKLMWLHDNDPQSIAEASYMIGIKEYILNRWCGADPSSGAAYVMDEAVAGGTGLYNVHSRDWDDEALALAGIGRELLPELAPTTRYFPGLLPEIALKLGIAANVPVVIGGADGVLANFGSGAVLPGIVEVTVGTSGAVRVAVNQPSAGDVGKLFCYPLAEQLWIAGGAVNSGGVVFRWLRDQLLPDVKLEAARDGEDAYKRLLEMASSVPPGAGSLLFLPHLTGERAPHYDERARGVWFGLSLEHERQHMLRAGLEGILFGLRSVLEGVSAAAGRPQEIRVSGGFTKPVAIRQLMADMFGCPVKISSTGDASAAGAAKLALFALGLAPTLAPAYIAPPPSLDSDSAEEYLAGEVCYPNKANAAVYDALYPQFRRIYEALKPSFSELAAYREQSSVVAKS